MATTTKSVDNELVKLGKSTLELLERREEAARLAAAKLELRSILSEAESGNVDRLKVWLHQNSDYAAEVQPSNGSDSTTQIADMHLRIDGGDSEKAVDLELGQSLSNEQNRVAQGIDLNQKTTQQEFPSLIDDPWKELLSASLQRTSSTSFNQPFSAEQKKSPDSELSVLPAQPAITNGMASEPIVATRSPTSASITKSKLAKPDVKQQPSIKLKLDHIYEGETETKKRALRWMSGSVGISLFVHMTMTIGLGLAVITISQPKEPISLTSSSYEEPATLESPLEIEQTEQLEVSEVSSQVEMASITTSVDSQATSNLVNVETGVGPISAPTNNPLGSTLVQATNAMGSKGDMMGAVQFMGVGAAGNTFAFLVDNSGSIAADGVFDMAKMELMRAIRALKPTQRFFVAFFGEELQVMAIENASPSDYPVYATPENIQKLERWVLTVKIQKGRHPGDAIELAIEKDPDAIFLLFDGATTIDLLGRVERVNRVSDLISGERPKVPINTLRFPPSKRDAADEPKFDAMMKKLAADNGGTYRYVPKPR